MGKIEENDEMNQLELISRNTFIIPVNGDFLVYAPLVGITAMLNRSGTLELKKQMQGILRNQEDPGSKLFNLAKDILYSPVLNPVQKKDELNPEFLGIIPTRLCNGSCNYCDFSPENSSSEKMSYNLAADIVDWYAEIVKSHARNILEIHFFGGEPMMAKDVIEVILHRSRLVSIENNLLPVFEISTNGQYDTADARFLGNYFNKVVLSLDGFEEIQHKHRPLKANKDSFRNAVETARIISNLTAELCIRCCVSQLNIFRLQEITHWLCKNFRLSAINFEILSASSKTTSKGLFPPDPVDFAFQFEKAREIANSYGIEVVYASDITGNPQLSSCPVGKDTVIVSPDGRISNCYLLPEKWRGVGLDLDFGTIHSKVKVDIDRDQLNTIREMVNNKPRCSSCFCQWSCAGGCHVGNTFPGSALEYDDFCKQTRLISTFSLLSALDRKEKIGEIHSSAEAVNGLIGQVSDRIENMDE